MRLQTTTIGAFPMPDYAPITDWFRGKEGPDTVSPTEGRAAPMAGVAARVAEGVIGAVRRCCGSPDRLDSRNAGLRITRPVRRRPAGRGARRRLRPAGTGPRHGEARQSLHRRT